MLAERREATGRRRRVYTISATGRTVLTEWLHATTNTPTAIHDLGLLKLYFAQLGTRDDLIALAEQQARAHRQRLTEYQSIAEQIGGDPRAAFALATLQMGLRYEEHAVIFWEQLVHNPPSLAGDAAQGADH